MNENSFTALSRRERQIMDILYRKGKGSVAEVQDEIKDEISYSTVRALLRILEEKGYLKHEEEGRKYIYKPVIPKKKAIKNAIDRLLNTFFNNSVEEAITALLEFDQENLNESDLDRLNEMIEKISETGLGAHIVDGPTGPAGIVKNGAVKIASSADGYLVPMYTVTEKDWHASSWDKFIIPKPFSKVKIVYKDPIKVEKTDNPELLEQYRKKLENELKPHLKYF